MTASRRLRIHHELLLLALHDKKGTLAFGQMQHIGLAGGLFAELLLAERIAIVEERRWKRTKEFVEVVARGGFGEGVMDAGLRKLADAKRRASPRDTVGRLGAIRGLRHDVGRELARMGVLRATEEDLLLFFKRRVYPTVDPGPERALITRILMEAGVTVSLHSDNAQIASRMNWEAGKLLRTGLTEEQALTTVTLNAAKVLAIDDRVGSLEVGKDADFVVWSGNPLSQFTKAEQTWVDGRRYFSLEEDAALREQVEDERSRLIQAVLIAAENNGNGRVAARRGN